MTATVAKPINPTPASPRLATAFLRGTPIRVPEPSWCVKDHTDANEDLVFIEDLSHEGTPVALPVPTFAGYEKALVARLVQWPFTDEPEPKLALEPTDSDDAAVLPASAALAFADQVVAHAESIRQQARVLAGGAA